MDNEIIKHNYISLNDWTEILSNSTLNDIIELWHTLTDEDKIKYFLHLDSELRVDFLLSLSINDQEELISNLAVKDIKELLEDIAPDDLVDLFQNVSPEVREAVWQHLSNESKQVTNFLLRFDADDAAGIMTPNYVKVGQNITVEQTIKFIRSNINEVETIYYIYIVDAIDRLQGVVSLRDLFRNTDSTKLVDFMNTKIISVHEDTDQEIVAKKLQEEDLLAIPVVDNFNRLLGIVTVDDAMYVISEEHNEDVLKMSAISVDEKHHALPYLETSAFSLFKSRIPWIAILLLAGTLTSNVIKLFSDLIYAAAYLVLFMPIITSTGGNIATQSATLMIRALSRNEVVFKNILKILLKEILVALMLGISLALVMLLRSLFFPPTLQIIQAIIISTSLVFVVFFSAIVGISAPLIISKLGADPTVIATPLLATLIDLSGLTIYFIMTKIFLSL